VIVLEKPTWLRTLLTLRGTSIGRTWPRLIVTTTIASVVTYFHEVHDMLHANLTITPFSLIGLALGIFLGFRNNTSYDRFWEGRKLWGRVVNASRTLTRQLLNLVGPGGASVEYHTTLNDDPEVGDDIREFHRSNIRRVMGYVHSLRKHLRDEDDLEELEPFFDADELESYRDELNRPIAILQRIGAEVRSAWDKGWIHPMHVSTVEDSLTELAGVQGGCERIKATPIPFSYNVLLHRIVAVYCFTLPFGLVEVVGIYTPIVELLVSYAFFGLDAVGDEIENPFGKDKNDLPLSAITRMIEVNLRQRLGETDLPPLKKPVKRVLE